MAIFRMKPFTVEAIEVDKILSSPENDWTGFPHWLRPAHESGRIRFEPDGIHIDIGEPYSTGFAPKGGWLGRGPDGNLLGFGADAFDARYDRVPNAHEPVARAAPRFNLVGDPFTCGSRKDQGNAVPGVDSDHWRKMPNGDRTCSYCGSLHEEDFFDIVEAYADGKDGYKFDPSTKPYKKYANRPGVSNASQGGIKFYGWHADLTPCPDLDRRNAIYRRAMARYHGEFVKGEEIVHNG